MKSRYIKQSQKNEEDQKARKTEDRRYTHAKCCRSRVGESKNGLVTAAGVESCGQRRNVQKLTASEKFLKLSY